MFLLSRLLSDYHGDSSLRITDFVEYFSLYLTPTQKRHLTHFLLAMILWMGVLTISRLSRLAPERGHWDQSTVNRFVTRYKWDHLLLARARWQWVQNTLSESISSPIVLDDDSAVVTGYLIIDDTVAPKTGERFPDVGYHYDHTQGRSVWGHCYVTAVYVIGGFRFPVTVKLYRSKKTCEREGLPFFSKLDLAAEIIEGFDPLPGTQTVVLTDAWYPSQQVIRAALDRGFHFVGQLKKNRLLYQNPQRDAPAEQLSAWGERMRNSHVVTVGEHTYRAAARTGYLKGGLYATVVASRSADDKRARFYVHLDPAQDPDKPSWVAEAILTAYRHRWWIEVFHRDVKEHLGFGDYRIRSRDGIDRYHELVLLAFTYLETHRGLGTQEMVDQPSLTLGQIIAWEQKRHEFEVIDWLFREFERGVSPDQIARELAA